MNCRYCKKETKLWGNRRVYYCNNICRYAHDAARRKAHHDPIACAVCSVEFVPKYKTGKFCSKLCRYISQKDAKSKKPPIKDCAVCKKTFTPYTSSDKFCSAECRVEQMKSKRCKRWNEESVQKRRGEANPAYVHGLSSGNKRMPADGLKAFFRNRNEIKEAMMDAQGYVCCQRCKRTNSKMEAHHIVYRSEKPNHPNLHDKVNIIIVCVPCHNWYHKSKGNRDDLVEKRGLSELFGVDILNKTKA